MAVTETADPTPRLIPALTVAKVGLGFGWNEVEELNVKRSFCAFGAVIAFNFGAASDSLLTNLGDVYSLTPMLLRLLKHLREESLSA